MNGTRTRTNTSALIAISTGLALAASVGSAAAQPAAGRPAAADLKESRYQIGQMERVLEGAVEHGAAVMRDRLRTALPADMLLSENARVRGFRLEGYGMMFDVEVPSLESAPIWSFRTLDQNDLGLRSALDALRTHVNAAGDADLQQALKRVELQVEPGGAAQGVDGTATARPVGGVGGVAGSAATADPAVTNAISNPVEAYRAEIKDAIMDAMLEHSRGLGIGADEWLVIAARSNAERPTLAPLDTDTQTVVIRVRGTDLTAFLGGQITHDEALKRMDVKVF